VTLWKRARLFNIFQVDVSLLSTTAVLLIMGAVAVVFALMLRQKSRALGRLPKDLSVRVFDRTFNVFDPSSERRRIVNSHTGLVIFVAVYGFWITATYVVFKAFEIGAILGSIAFLICAALLMIDETQEFNRNAGIFVKAIAKGSGLGKGDLRVLAVMRKTLPRLSKYHLVLAVLFFASALAVPFLVDAVFLATAGVASVVFALSLVFKAFPIFPFFVIAGMFAAAVVLAQIAVNKTKKRVFGFPLPVPIDVESRQFFRMKMYVGVLHHHPTLREPSPEDTDRINEQDLDKHSEH
jgi:hypothetical protein